MTKRFDETVVEFDYDILLADYSAPVCYYPCLTEWDICILLSVLRIGDFPSRWRGSSDSSSWPLSLYLGNAERNSELSTALGNVETLRAKLIMATCGTEIKEGLQAIADALAGQTFNMSQTQEQNCGCGGVTLEITNLIQGVTGNGSAIYGSGPANPGEGESGVPEGWVGNEAEYWVHKCQAANIIVDGLIASMHALATLDIALLIQGGIAASVVFGLMGAGVTVPPLAAAALIAALIGLGLSLDALEDISDYWQSHRDTFVCSLYNSSDTGAAIQVVEDYIDEALGAMAVSAPLHPFIRTIGLIMASTDTIDQLFDLTLAITYPDADCEACSDSRYDFEYGEVYPTLPYATVIDNGFDQFQTDTGAVPNWNQNDFYANFRVFEAGTETPAGVWFNDVSITCTGTIGCHLVDTSNQDHGSGGQKTPSEMVAWLEAQRYQYGYKSGYFYCTAQANIDFSLLQGT